MFKESDESVVERWIENAYWQYFSGGDFFQTKQPFDPSEFVHFRKGLKEKGLEFILRQTVALHPEAKKRKGSTDRYYGYGEEHYFSDRCQISQKGN
jgi:IS5 family transposase